MAGLRCVCDRYESAKSASLGEVCVCENSSLRSSRKTRFSFVAVRRKS